jgi:hypothetical protein
MIISDLSFCDDLSNETAQVSGQGAAVSASSVVLALGDFTRTITDAKVWAYSSPYTGAIAIGYTLGGGLGYTPPKGGYSLPDWQAFVTQYT